MDDAMGELRAGSGACAESRTILGMMAIRRIRLRASASILRQHRARRRAAATHQLTVADGETVPLEASSARHSSQQGIVPPEI